MSMVRRTVTLDAEAVAAAAELADGNFSAYVNEALLRRIRQDRLAVLIAEDERRRGSLDPAGVARVERELRELEAEQRGPTTR